MANPQPDKHLRISNEIWDQLTMRDFSKRQRSILDLILRLSYGCGKKHAIIPTLKSFSLAGVGQNHVRSEIEHLERSRVISWQRDTMNFAFNKNYDEWWIQPTRGYDEAKLDELIHLNIADKKRFSTLPETGTIVHTTLPETGSRIGDTGSQNGKSDFPKQEVEVPEMGSLGFPKWEVDQPPNPHNNGPNEPPKDSIKDTLKTLKDIQTFVPSCVERGKDPLYEAWHLLVGLGGSSVHAELDPWSHEHGMEIGVVIAAVVSGVEQKAKQGKKPWPGYVSGILRNWHNDGVRTLDDIRERDGPQTEEEYEVALLKRMEELDGGD